MGTKCKGKGIYIIKTYEKNNSSNLHLINNNNFEITKQHNIKYKEHSYKRVKKNYRRYKYFTKKNVKKNYKIIIIW